MNKSAMLQWAEETWELLPLPGIWWPRMQYLIITDLHLGKVGHFRKHGMAVPQGGAEQLLERVFATALAKGAKGVLHLGDLFHSSANQEWRLLLEMMHQHPGLNHLLVKGNHDILPKAYYGDPQLFVFDENLVEGKVLFTHHPMEQVPPGMFNIAGHIHPSVRLSGSGRQGLRLPAFVFKRQQALLPACGHFTGSATVPVQAEDQAFVLVQDQVIKK